MKGCQKWLKIIVKLPLKWQQQHQTGFEKKHHWRASQHSAEKKNHPLHNFTVLKLLDFSHFSTFFLQESNIIWFNFDVNSSQLMTYEFCKKFLKI